MKLWGERLKMLRLEHGMTQQALALTNQTDILQCVLLSSFTYYYQYLPELFSVNV